MARPVSSALQNLLDLGSCETQTTLDIVPVSGSPIYMATKALTANSHTYTADLQSTGEIKQSIFAPPDRVTAQIQNVDKAIGATVTAESLAKATAIVGRYFSDPAGMLPSVWVELFRGQLKPVDLDEATSKGEILDDLAAAGYCIAHWSLAGNCQNVFKNAVTCGYAGGLTECNKRRKSPDGCSGRINSGTVTNEHRFNGMEFPDVQGPELPALSGPGGHWPWCPRLDQWVLARSAYSGEPRPKQVRMLGTKDELYDPVAGEFVAIKAITIIQNVSVWELTTTNGGRAYSSRSHPIIRSLTDDKGLAVVKLRHGDGVLTYSKGAFAPAAVDSVADTGECDAVARIELATGHIYAYSDKGSGPFIVCHNSKEPPEPE